MSCPWQLVSALILRDPLAALAFSSGLCDVGRSAGVLAFVLVAVILGTLALRKSLSGP